MSYHVSPAPYAVFSSSQTQSISNIANSQAITYNTTNFSKGITLVDNSKITLPQVGNYALSFSAIGHDSGSASAKWFNIFLKKNGNIVSNSSSIVAVAKDLPSTIVATFDISCVTAGDYYELLMAGETTGCQILATPAQPAVPLVSPEMPACPSIVVVAWQIS